MPNIEIHGIGDKLRERRIRDKIFSIFEPLRAKHSFVDAIVVTTCQDSVVEFFACSQGFKSVGSIEGRQPFFRIYYTAEDNMDLISNMLRPFCLDIELVPLKDFIPRYDHDEDPDDQLERPAKKRYEDC